MTDVLHQRGAGGLIAEYRCAAALQEALEQSGYIMDSSLSWLERKLAMTIPRVGNELSPTLRGHALAQGDALAAYIAQCITAEPARLGLVLSVADIRRGRISINTVGNATNSGTSADLLIEITLDGAVVQLPISLKAYRGSTSSLGSKGARASLGRLFMGKAKVSDEELTQHFGAPADHFSHLLADFKMAAREFYNSPDGRAFVTDYQKRKGDPYARVNNPLRRKEVGDYFIVSRGFRPEHRFAELYADMFSIGMSRVQHDGGYEEWVAFLEGLRFLIGMDQDVVTLTASGQADNVITVSNSLDEGPYADLRAVLIRGCDVQLQVRPASSVLGVSVTYASITVEALSLTIWKDATIQFKLDGGTSYR